jgi:hypothetical protein
MTVAAALALPATPARAQFKSMDEPKSRPTGRTEEGLKIDAEIDKDYRAKAGRDMPTVKGDPWADVRTPPAKPADKTTNKQ